MHKIDKLLQPLSPDYIGAYLDKSIQLYDLIDWILKYTGSAVITVLTFSISEEFIRKIYQLKKESKIKHITVILDFKAIQKTEKIVRLAGNVFDKLEYAKTHAKIVLIESENMKVCISGSQNATRGNREEGGIITTNISTYLTFKTQIERIQKNGIFRRDIASENK